ncbi:MAG: PIG-L family deacetylase [Chloroflexi bacterium]|nr:PIG-L family deacetylase [Chloroflexota bacterium]
MRLGGLIIDGDNAMFNALYLSPHFDDAVFSCGGQIYQRVRRGERVAVVTVCAAPPPPPAEWSPFAAGLHARWSAQGAAAVNRAREDRAALAMLGAESAHLAFHDCIYRRAVGGWLYASEQAIFGELSPLEEGLVERVAAELGRVAEPASGGEVFSPFGLGHHVDHQLARCAAERWSARAGVHLHYYADYPYAASAPLAGFAEVALSAEARQAKLRAFQAYSSQLSTFWADEAAVAEAAGHWAEQVFD